MQKSFFSFVVFFFLWISGYVFGAQFSVGDRYKGFVVTKSIDIQELDCHLTELTHIRSGAQVVHIEAKDPENFFSIDFRTPSTSSRGTAHVLEHTVLTGSQKFPTELFFAMRRRSLSTYMNAATGRDYTYYPAASLIEEDFYNLFSVYFDAVFHPLLREESFAQEGCRLEFTARTDPTTELVYKGVVYNEMKGALSSPERLLAELLGAELFQDTPYRYNSGGDPLEIPDLTHEELVAYHQDHYFPNNCIFFFYGDIPLYKHLDFLAKQNLASLPNRPPLPPMPMQPRFTERVTKTSTFPAQDASQQALLGFSWLTAPVYASDELFGLMILDAILMDSDAAALKSKLLESGLCRHATSELELRLAECAYSIHLQGCKAEDAEALDAMLYGALREICEQGITQEMIDAACYQVELSLSEIGGNGQPFGLTLFTQCVRAKRHGGHVEDTLCVQGLFKRFRKNLRENPCYLSDLIEKYFLDNLHAVRVCLAPSQEQANAQFEAEKERLRRVRNSLSAGDVDAIVQRSLKRLIHDSALLPKTSLADATKAVHHLDLEELSLDAMEIFYHDVHTNGITYLDMVFELPEVPLDDLWVLQLFTKLMPEVGCGKRSASEHLRFVQNTSSPIYAATLLQKSVYDSSFVCPMLHVAGHALDRKGDMLFSIFYDMATSLSFADKAHVKELVLKHYTDLENQLNMNGLSYALRASLASASPAGYLEEQTLGLEYYYKLKRLVMNFDEEAERLIACLTEVQKKLFCVRKPHLVIACSRSAFEGYRESAFGKLKELPICDYNPFTSRVFDVAKGSFAHPISSLVAFIARGFKTVPFAHPDSASVSLASYIFTNSVLHRRIREQGGAYGGGARHDAVSGNFWFYSYRDPHIAETLAAFDEAIEKGVQGPITADEVEEAKLQLLQRYIVPVAPGLRAFVAYQRCLEGKTTQLVEMYLANILNATGQDIQKAIALYIAPRYKESVLVILAPIELLGELLEQENKKLETLLPILSYA